MVPSSNIHFLVLLPRACRERFALIATPSHVVSRHPKLIRAIGWEVEQEIVVRGGRSSYIQRPARASKQKRRGRWLFTYSTVMLERTREAQTDLQLATIRVGPGVCCTFNIVCAGGARNSLMLHFVD